MYNHLLDTFILVADEKSINKASEKLFISPVSVMKQIRKLEEQFNMKLFTTSAKGCILTKQGEEFYKGAKEIIDYSNKVMSKIKPPEHIVLKFGISLFDNGDIFFKKWNMIENKFPNIKLNLIPIEEGKIGFKSLKNGEVDFIVGLSDFYEKPKYDNIQIGARKHVLVAPKNHKLANAKSIKISDLDNFSINIPKPGLFVSFDELVNDTKEKSNLIIFNELKLETNLSKIMNDSVNNNALFFATDSLDNKHPGLVTIPLEFGKDVPYCLFYTRKLIREHPEVRHMLVSFKELC